MAAPGVSPEAIPRAPQPVQIAQPVPASLPPPLTAPAVVLAVAQPLAAPAAQTAQPARRAPAAIQMTATRCKRLLERLIAKDYWDFSKGLPARGEVQAFDMLWRSLLDEDSGWVLNLENVLGQKQKDGEAFQGGQFLQSQRKIMREKWEETLGCTGDGGESAKARAARKWLDDRGCLQLCQQLFAGEKVRGRAAGKRARGASVATAIDLAQEAGAGTHVTGKLGEACSSSWGGKNIHPFK